MENIEELIRSGKATIVDVRTPAEFKGGNCNGSTNIPMQEIPERLSELSELKNLVVCCASGNRSRQVVNFLKQVGIQCVDGGSWMDINS